jgi:negative regulator of sigma E activity
MSDQPITDFANRLRACLDAEDANAALIALSGEPQALTGLPRIPRKQWYEEDRPHAVVGLATALMANALIR